MMDNDQEIDKTSYSYINNCFSERKCFNETDSGYLSFSPNSKSYESTYLNQSKLSLFSAKRFRRSKTNPYSTKLDCYSFNKNYLRSTKKSSSTNFLNIRSSVQDLEKQHSQTSFKMKLRSHKKQSSTLSVAVTACKKNYHNILSSPISSAIPLSVFDDNSLDIDTEVKLVIPQSTPYIMNSSILSTPTHNITFSPIIYKSDSYIGSMNNKRFNSLHITEHTIISKKGKPKKLDFSKRAIFLSFQKQRATPDFTGKETVDIFKVLAEQSNHPRIVSMILDYLNPQDLCSASMVSRSWQRICNNDVKAKERKLKHIILKQHSKENLVSTDKSKFEGEVLMSPKTRYSKRSFLTAVSINLLQVPKSHLTPNSPPVSPSKVIFHSFIKAGRSLAPRDQLIPCPQCKFACRVESEKNVGMCSRQGCPMEKFCILCSSKLHNEEPCKMPLLATPTKRNKLQPIVGTKQCKKNLRRISRLIC